VRRFLVLIFVLVFSVPQLQVLEASSIDSSILTTFCAKVLNITDNGELLVIRDNKQLTRRVFLKESDIGLFEPMDCLYVMGVKRSTSNLLVEATDIEKLECKENIDKDIILEVGTSKAVINGEEISLDAPLIRESGVLFLSHREISKIFDLKCELHLMRNVLRFYTCTSYLVADVSLDESGDVAVNGDKKKFSVSVYNLNANVLIPVVEFAEMIGIDCEIDGENLNFQTQSAQIPDIEDVRDYGKIIAYTLPDFVDHGSIEYALPAFGAKYRFDDELLLPIEKLREYVGFDYAYDRGTDTYTLTVGDQKITLNTDSSRARVNEFDVVVDYPATYLERKLHLPVHFIVESFGGMASWNDEKSCLVCFMPKDYLGTNKMPAIEKRIVRLKRKISQNEAEVSDFSSGESFTAVFGVPWRWDNLLMPGGTPGAIIGVTGFADSSGKFCIKYFEPHIANETDEESPLGKTRLSFKPGGKALQVDYFPNVFQSNIKTIDVGTPIEFRDGYHWIPMLGLESVSGVKVEYDNYNYYPSGQVRITIGRKVLILSGGNDVFLDGSKIDFPIVTSNVGVILLPIEKLVEHIGGSIEKEGDYLTVDLRFLSSNKISTVHHFTTYGENIWSQVSLCDDFIYRNVKLFTPIPPIKEECDCLINGYIMLNETNGEEFISSVIRPLEGEKGLDGHVVEIVDKSGFDTTNFMGFVVGRDRWGYEWNIFGSGYQLDAVEIGKQYQIEAQLLSDEFKEKTLLCTSLRLYDRYDTEANAQVVKKNVKVELSIGSKTAFVDGEEIWLSTPAQVVEGRTLIPLRFVGEAFGAEVVWHSYNRSIEVTTDNIKIWMAVYNPTMFVNGERVELDVAPTIIGGSTLMPFRALAEALQMDVEWVAETRTVVIYGFTWEYIVPMQDVVLRRETIPEDFTGYDYEYYDENDDVVTVSFYELSELSPGNWAKTNLKPGESYWFKGHFLDDYSLYFVVDEVAPEMEPFKTYKTDYHSVDLNPFLWRSAVQVGHKVSDYPPVFEALDLNRNKIFLRMSETLSDSIRPGDRVVIDYDMSYPAGYTSGVFVKSVLQHDISKMVSKVAIFEEGKNTAIVDGIDVELKAPPKFISGEMLIPIRNFAELTGTEIIWNAQDKSIDIMYVRTYIWIQINNKTMLVNGEEVTIDIPASIVGGMIMFPIESLIKVLGGSVNTNGNKCTVNLPDIYEKAWGGSN